MRCSPARLTTAEFVAGLSIKILLGFLYGYIYLNFYNGDDTWRFQRVSLEETSLLLNDPKSFFIREFTPAHALAEGEGWRQVLSLYLNDLQYALVVKTLAIMNLVTGGNYYINSAIFNGVFFWGHYWIFATFSSLYPVKRKLYFWISFFFLPAVFWLSGLRIDGWLFFFLALFIYNLSNTTARHRLLLLFIAYTGVIIIARPEVAALMVPAAAGYVLSKKCEPWAAYTFALLCSIVLFFGSSLIFKGGGLPGAVAAKQHLFHQLEGTRFPLPKLNSGVVSYLYALPQAWSNTFIRPFPWEAAGFLQLLASAEILIFWLLFALMVWNIEADWKRRLRHPVLLFMLFVSVGMYITIGYLVPFPGAIIRYKAAALLILLMLMATLTKTNRIKFLNI